jgi:hypothetical protein
VWYQHPSTSPKDVAVAGLEFVFVAVVGREHNEEVVACVSTLLANAWCVPEYCPEKEDFKGDGSSSYTSRSESPS